MSQSRRTVEQLSAEIGSDFDGYIDDLFGNLKATTPIRTGQARRSWKKTGKDPIKSGRRETVLQNTVDYADRLDKGYSSQAPRGIVKPAFNRTRKK